MKQREYSETGSHIYIHLIFDTYSKAIQWRKDSHSKNTAGEIEHPEACMHTHINTHKCTGPTQKLLYLIQKLT